MTPKQIELARHALGLDGRRKQSYNGLTRSRISTSHTDEGLATADIYRQVIRSAEWWNGQRVVTDADYAAELAEINGQD